MQSPRSHLLGLWSVPILPPWQAHQAFTPAAHCYVIIILACLLCAFRQALADLQLNPNMELDNRIKDLRAVRACWRDAHMLTRSADC